MSRRRKWIAGGGLLCLIAVGIYFAWGAKLEAEYERRVQALRSRGDYVDEPRSWYAETPIEENAAVVLTEAAELLQKLQGDDDELAGLVAQFTFAGWDSEWHDAEDYERLRRKWPKLDGYFAKLEVADRRPVFAPPPATTDHVASVFGIQYVAELLRVRARIRPETAPDSVRILLNLAERWRADGVLDMRLRLTVRAVALQVLQVGLRDGTLDVSGHREAWDRQLAGIEPIPMLRETLRYTRMEQIRFYEQLRDGVDPFAEARKASEEVTNDPKFRELFELPWCARWYGRPVLHREALRMLDETEFAIAHATSERALREALREEHAKRTGLGKRFFGEYARVLEHLAEIRLARVAMAIQVDAKAHGGARETLDAHAPALGSASLEDPFTGTPFPYERHEDRVVLSCSVGIPGEGEWESLRSRLLERWTIEELLRWEVRWAPTNQAD